MLIGKLTPASVEYNLEIRYKPNMAVIDNLGTWSVLLGDKLALPSRRVSNDTLEVSSNDKILRAFVSHRRFGCMAADLDTTNIFKQTGRKLIQELMTIVVFGDPVHVQRIGVRLKCITEHKGGFEDLMKKYHAIHLKPSAALVDQIIGPNGRWADIGAPLHFQNDLGRCNTSSGPMIRSQAEGFLPNAKVCPDVGLYVDVDYSRLPDAPINSNDLQNAFLDLVSVSDKTMHGIIETILS